MHTIDKTTISLTGVFIRLFVSFFHSLTLFNIFVNPALFIYSTFFFYVCVCVYVSFWSLTKVLVKMQPHYTFLKHSFAHNDFCIFLYIPLKHTLTYTYMIVERSLVQTNVKQKNPLKTTTAMVKKKLYLLVFASLVSYTFPI